LRDSYVKINDRFAAEFLMNAYTAALEKVPVVFVSGDAGLCEDAASFIPAITGVAVKEGLGSSTLSLHPQVAVQRIAEGVEKALKGDLARCLVTLPRHFSVEIGYRDHFKAYAMSFFPGAKLKDANTITFESDDYFEVLKLFLFVF
jgi:D-amino peptidase